MKRLLVVFLIAFPMLAACGDEEGTAGMSSTIVSPLALDLAWGDVAVEVQYAGPVVQIQLLANDETAVTYDVTDTSGTAILTWTSTGCADGSATLIARVLDSSGGFADSNPIEVSVDNTAPTATVDMTRLAIVSGEVAVPATIADANLSTVKLFNRDGLLRELEGEASTFNVDTRVLSEGVHWLRVEATDLAGHTTTSDEVPIVVANNGEEVTITYYPEANYYIPSNYASVEHHVRTSTPSTTGVTRIVSWLTWDGTSGWNMELAIGQGICPHRGVRYSAVESTSGEIVIDLPRSELPADIVAQLPSADQTSTTYPTNDDPATWGSFFAHVGVMNPADHVGETIPIDVHFMLFY